MGLNIGKAITGGLAGFATGGFAGAAVGAAAGAFSKDGNAAGGYNDAANRAAQGARFAPVNVSGSFGQGTFNPAVAADPSTGAAATPASAGFQLSPQMQQMQDMFGAQATQFAGQGQTGIGQQAMDLSAGFLGQAQVDPNQMAQSQFAKMQEILAPSRSRSQEALTSRLLQQGRLGSTGGALSEQAQLAAFGQQDQRMLFDAMAQGQQVQQNQLNQGTRLGLFGQGQEDIGFNRAQSRLGAMQDIDQQGMGYLKLGGQFGSYGAQAGANAGQLAMQGADVLAREQFGQEDAWYDSIGQIAGLFNGGGDDSFSPNNGAYTQGDAYQDIYDFGFDAGD